MDNVQDPVQEAPEGQAEPTAEQTPVQTDDVPSEGTAFADLAVKKGFKTPDDLAKAYANLESQNKKVEMRKADLEKEFFKTENYSPKPTGQERPRELSPDEQALTELDKFVSERLTKQEQSLKQEFKTELSKLELRQVLKENPDFGKYALDVKDLKAKYPDMPFAEALTVAKALKGDLVKEAKAEGMKQSTEAVVRQQQAQVAQEKKSTETEISVGDLLKGAGERWKPNARGQVAPEAQAEIEMLEKKLFGRVLTKTDKGL